MGVAVAVWCTSCESMGSEIMEVPVTTVLLDTHCAVQFVYYTLYSVPEEEWIRDDGSATTLVDIVTRTACCSDQRLLSFILHIFNWPRDQITEIFT